MLGHFIQKHSEPRPRPAEIHTPSALAQLLGTIRLLRGFDDVQPLELSVSEVDKVLSIGSAGRYVLGRCDSRGSFHTQFVGSSDDLNATLKEQIGSYEQFKIIIGQEIQPRRSR